MQGLAEDASPGAQSDIEAQTQITASRGFARWLAIYGASLAFTSYQTGQMFLVGVTSEGTLSIHQRNFLRAMGLAGDANRLYLASLAQIWRLENVLAPQERANGYFDHLYVPRNGQTVADLDVHELGIEASGRVIFVNTKYSCLATTSTSHSFKPIWRPDFISRLAPEDRCHLNGLCMENGRPRYVTAVSTTDIVDGWRSCRRDGGVVIDIETDARVVEGLSMPHSPRLHDGALWLLDSGNGYLVRVDLTTGQTERVAFLPGFLRGLSFHAGHAFVGLSMPRDGAFHGLALQEELSRRGGTPWCGVQIVNVTNGDVVEWLRLDGAIRELFDVKVLPGVACPMALSTSGPDLVSFVTIEPPDYPLADRGYR